MDRAVQYSTERERYLDDKLLVGRGGGLAQLWIVFNWTILRHPLGSMKDPASFQLRNSRKIVDRLHHPSSIAEDVAVFQ